MDDNCELYERICINCGECEICDLNSKKRCNNCGKCIDDVEEYRTVNLEEFIETHFEMPDLDKKKD